MPTKTCFGSAVGPMDRPATPSRRIFAGAPKSIVLVSQDTLLNGMDLSTRILTCTGKFKIGHNKNIMLLGGQGTFVVY